MTHEEKITQWIGPGKIGTEIGAGSAPVPGLEPPPIYVDCFKEFGSMTCVADYYGHACALPFHDNTLDYVIASHVLEHVANPVAALAEWYRVLRPGGIIYLLVPDRRYTWDRGRALTSVEHMLEDYRRCTPPSDATHIDDFVGDVDWAEWCPTVPADEVPEKKREVATILHANVARGEEINIHFHTFEPANVRALLETLATRQPPAETNGDTPLPRFNWEIVDFAERFPASNPNGVLAILRVYKGWRARADAEVFRLRTHGDRYAVIRDDAKPFADWAATARGLGGVNHE
jgi:SAM-dependent methyltransferase